MLAAAVHASSAFEIHFLDLLNTGNRTLIKDDGGRRGKLDRKKGDLGGSARHASHLIQRRRQRLPTERCLVEHFSAPAVYAFMHYCSLVHPYLPCSPPLLFCRSCVCGCRSF